MRANIVTLSHTVNIQQSVLLIGKKLSDRLITNRKLSIKSDATPGIDLKKVKYC